MRAIKCCAWDEEEKRWIGKGSLDYLCVCGDVVVLVKYGPNKTGGYDPISMRQLTNPEVDRLEIQQFTGLHDKHGIEIWEGDIVAIKFNPKWVARFTWKGEPDAIAEIYWDYNGFRLKAKRKEDLRYIDFWDEDGWKMLDMNLKHTEVIGNVKNNPELLK